MTRVELERIDRRPPTSKGRLLTCQVVVVCGIPTVLQLRETSCFHALITSLPKDAILAGTLFDGRTVTTRVLAPSPTC